MNDHTDETPAEGEAKKRRGRPAASAKNKTEPAVVQEAPPTKITLRDALAAKAAKAAKAKADAEASPAAEDISTKPASKGPRRRVKDEAPVAAETAAHAAPASPAHAAPASPAHAAPASPAHAPAPLVDANGPNALERLFAASEAKEAAAPVPAALKLSEPPVPAPELREADPYVDDRKIVIKEVPPADDATANAFFALVSNKLSQVKSLPPPAIEPDPLLPPPRRREEARAVVPEGRREAPPEGRRDQGRERDREPPRDSREARMQEKFSRNRARGLPEDFELEDEERRLIEAAASGEAGLDIAELNAKSMQELNDLALDLGIEGTGSIGKQDLVHEIIKHKSKERGVLFGGGVLELNGQEGFGFLRNPEYSFQPNPEDIYLSPTQVKRYSLRTGDTIMGQFRAPREKERYFCMLKIDSVNGDPPMSKKSKIPFESLTPDFPNKRLVMEDRPDNIPMRVLDLVTPIGAGQRGLIVAPPRTGKTVLMQQIAQSIATNNPEAHLIVLLIDERPEEVTDMKRVVRGEVIASTFDEPQSRHIQVAEMVIEKARRLVEHGRHVIILLDSITRLARAYNAAQPNSGKIMSGGLDTNALTKPKRFFGAARNVQEGGSLTILATALVDTGSTMDEVIFQEFKGTGNMEIHLDRGLVDKRIFPAINIEKSGTRKEELLLHPDEKERVWKLRRALLGMPPAEAMQLLVNGVKKTKSNPQFLMTLQV
ncbi:MAG: transcription termination factor Rho [Verrucomicrobiota bacterium]|jgi:transcription termination factor Rho